MPGTQWSTTVISGVTALDESRLCEVQHGQMGRRAKDAEFGKVFSARRVKVETKRMEVLHIIAVRRAVSIKDLLNDPRKGQERKVLFAIWAKKNVRKRGGKHGPLASCRYDLTRRTRRPRRNACCRRSLAARELGRVLRVDLDSRSSFSLMWYLCLSSFGALALILPLRVGSFILLGANFLD